MNEENKLHYRLVKIEHLVEDLYDESLKAYLAPTRLVSEPRGDLTCRGVEEPWKLYVLYEPECVGV